jgi:hypothetical protein
MSGGKPGRRERKYQEKTDMRKILISMIAGAALLSACGSAPVQDAANQAGTAVSAPDVSTAISAPEVGTAVAAPEVGTAIDDAATAVSGPEGATAEAAANDALTAAADDVTIQQGQALVLDATKSAGDISDYKWTITKAPSGAESVIGQTIKEGSNGNVSLNPDDYTKYFPAAGDYTIQLTVSDTAGKTSSDQFTLTMP